MTSRYERQFVLEHPRDANQYMHQRDIHEYYATVSRSTANTSAPIALSEPSFEVHRTMAVIDEKLFFSTTAELSVSSHALVGRPHSDWIEQFAIEVGDPDLGALLAHAPELQRTTYRERRVTWRRGYLRLRQEPLSLDGLTRAAWVFSNEADAMEFQPPPWSSLVVETGQDVHVTKVDSSRENSVEYEARFLVDADRAAEFMHASERKWVGQSYLVTANDAAVRVRVSGETGVDSPDATGQVAIKGARRENGRVEIEGYLPIDVARAFLRAGFPTVEKTRHSKILSDGFAWEVDVFEGSNAPLVIAECEVHDPEDLARIQPPEFCGPDIGADTRYNNESLARVPFASW